MKCRWCKKRKTSAFGLCIRCYHRVYYGIKSGRWNSHLREWRMPIIKATDKAYLAGLIDGEGCIKLYPHIKPPCQITIANNNKKVLDWVKDKLECGNVYIHKLPPERKHNTQYQWRVASREQIQKILTKIRPYLIIKTDQAEKMLGYIHQNPYRGYRISECPPQILKVMRNKYANTTS